MEFRNRGSVGANGEAGAAGADGRSRSREAKKVGKTRGSELMFAALLIVRDLQL